MAMNPMQRKANNSFLLGILITLLITGAIIAFLIYQVSSLNKEMEEIVFDIRKEKNPCSLCANLRRGIINSIAIKEGCNKIALGHNQDDVLETFLLNLFYTGSIGTFSPVSYMDRSKITLIRPLIYTPKLHLRMVHYPWRCKQCQKRF